jgi:non-ribosomal peptide synthetase component F
MIVFGGEALEVRNLNPWLDQHGDQRPQLVNMYGITETTVHVTAKILNRAQINQAQASPIGRPLSDLKVYILDHHLNQLPVGVAGEIYVGGAGVARGYLNQAERTAERFIPDPFNGDSGERLYKTGDVGRYLPNGNIEFVGRLDHQVKIRGYRIELGEIEEALRLHPVVKQTVVEVNEVGFGEKRLVAYLVSQSRSQPNNSEVRQYLRSKLPEYMVPVAYVWTSFRCFPARK